MEMAAIRRKAIPVNSLLYSLPYVMNHTTTATITAGRKKNRTFARNTIIRTPIIKRINKTAHSSNRGRKGNTNSSNQRIV